MVSTKLVPLKIWVEAVLAREYAISFDRLGAQILEPPLWCEPPFDLPALPAKPPFLFFGAALAATSLGGSSAKEKEDSVGLNSPFSFFPLLYFSWRLLQGVSFASLYCYAHGHVTGREPCVALSGALRAACSSSLFLFTLPSRKRLFCDDGVIQTAVRTFDKAV